MKFAKSTICFALFTALIFFALTTVSPAAMLFNGPRIDSRQGPRTATGSLDARGEQVLSDDCQATSVTIYGTITGTVDDGGGYDIVKFELWDDGKLMDSGELQVAVGSTQTVSVTLSFDALYGHSVPGVGVYCKETGWDVDPFYPEDVEGDCSQTKILSISKFGTGSGTVRSQPEGISCGGDCSENFKEGSTVTLIATPDSGSVFAGWSGSETGTSSTCSIVMRTNKSVYAEFKEATVECGKVQLISPSGQIVGTTPTFEWQDLPCATWYQIWVNKDDTVVAHQWIRALDVRDGSTCYLMLPTEFDNGEYTWWIQGWNNDDGYGEWSDGMSFSIGTEDCGDLNQDGVINKKDLILWIEKYLPDCSK